METVLMCVGAPSDGGVTIEYITKQPASMALSMSSLSPLTASILSCVSVAWPTASSSWLSWLVHRSHVASVPLPLPPVGCASIAATVGPLVWIGWAGPVPLVCIMRARLAVAGRMVDVLPVLVAAPASVTPASATRAARVVIALRLNIGTDPFGVGFEESPIVRDTRPAVCQ